MRCHDAERGIQKNLLKEKIAAFRPRISIRLFLSKLLSSLPNNSSTHSFFCPSPFSSLLSAAFSFLAR